MGKKPNVLMLMNAAGVGGAEGVFTRHYESFVRRKKPVALATLRGTSPYVSFDFRSLFDMAAYKRLRSYIRANNIGVIYATLDMAIAVSRIVACVTPEVNVVIRESGMANRKSIRMKLLDILTNWRVSAIIAVSDEVKKSLLTYQPWYGRKIHVVHNGITAQEDIDEILEVREGRRKEHPNTYTILHVGSMNTPNKGQDKILGLLARLVREHPEINWQLVLAGGGALKDGLVRQKEELHLNKQVHFTGSISPEELAHYYRTSDMFILYSENEGCPNVVLEAMSYGLPVLTTPVGGVHALVEDGVTGYIIPRDNVDLFVQTVVAFAQGTHNGYTVGRAGYERARNHFDFQEQVTKIEELLFTS